MKPYRFLFSFCLGVAVSWGASEAAPLHLALEDAIQMTLETDGTIKAARSTDEAARWTLSSARRAAGPGLRWTSAGMKNGGRDYRNPGMDRTFSNSVGLQIPLYTGGRLENNMRRYRLRRGIRDAGH